MVATKVAALLVCMFVAAAQANDIAREVFDETPKCLPSVAAMPVLLQCFKEVTGNDFDHKTTKSSDINEDVKVNIGLCINKRFKVVSEDGATFDVDRLKLGLGFTDIEDSVQDKLKQGFDECAAKGGDGRAFTKCEHDVFMKQPFKDYKMADLEAANHGFVVRFRLSEIKHCV